MACAVICRDREVVARRKAGEGMEGDAIEDAELTARGGRRRNDEGAGGGGAVPGVMLLVVPCALIVTTALQGAQTCSFVAQGKEEDKITLSLPRRQRNPGRAAR